VPQLVKLVYDFATALTRVKSAVQKMDVCRRKHNVYDLVNHQNQAVALAAATAGQTPHFLAGFAPPTNGASAAIGGGLQMPLANQVRRNNWLSSTRSFVENALAVSPGKCI